jgi:hypothetical protein
MNDRFSTAHLGVDFDSVIHDCTLGRWSKDARRRTRMSAPMAKEKITVVLTKIDTALRAASPYQEWRNVPQDA